MRYLKGEAKGPGRMVGGDNYTVQYSTDGKTWIMEYDDTKMALNGDFRTKVTAADLTEAEHTSEKSRHPIVQVKV